MKSKLKKQILTGLATLIALVLVSASSYSQEKTSIRPTLLLNYVKTNNIGTLVSKLTYSAETTEFPLKGMEIVFTNTKDSKELGIITTNADGIAVFSFPENEKLPSDAEGNWDFTADFRGKDSIDAASAEVTGRDVILETSLSLVDSIKTITMHAYTYNGDKKSPAAGEILNVSVPRMFSYLPVGEVTLDENGKGSIEFPSDIPGDSLGNLVVVTRFLEHPSFATVESRVTEKWGVPTHYGFPKSHRALWTKTPPMWMIITLSVLLTGVWGHYMFAVISLILIKIDARRKKAKEEYKL